jgi:hypothetical protein
VVADWKSATRQVRNLRYELRTRKIEMRTTGWIIEEFHGQDKEKWLS